MKTFPQILPLLLIAAALLLTACKPDDSSSSATEPTYSDTSILETGTLVHATIFTEPPPTGTITTRSHILLLGGKITIYSNDLVVITDTAGIKHAAPLEWCSDLVYK